MNEKDNSPIEVEERTPDDPDEQQKIRDLIEREAKQLELLRDMVETGEFPRSLLNQMIDLGMLAQADDVTPCKQDGRIDHPLDWYRALGRYRDHLENPNPPPPPKEDDWFESGTWRRSICLPATGSYYCPVLARASEWGEEAPAPCVEARITQKQTRNYRENPQKQERLSDPEDPVNVLQFRPCRVLGNLLYDEIFVVVTRRKREAERKRWLNIGKPQA